MMFPRISDRLLVRITVAIWVIAYSVLCAPTLLHGRNKGSVYPDFSSAGQHWFSSDQLYVRGGKNEFRYSPLVAAFFVPFEMLPPRVGEFLWRTLNFSALAGGLYYCWRAGVPRLFSIAETCAVFLLCMPLALGSLNNAQSNPLVLGLLLIAAAAVMRKRWTLCCVAITLSTCFKLYPIVFGLLLVLIYPRQLGWRLFVCLIAAAVLPFVLQRATYVMDQYAVWVQYLSTEDRQYGPMTDWYRDFRALWRVYIMSTRQNTYLLIEMLSGALIALTCVIARLRRMPDGLWIAGTLSLGCCWMTVFGPATESPTYILLAPAVAWGIVLSERDPRSAIPRVGYAIVFGLFIVSQLALNAGPAGKFFRDHLQPLPLAGLFLTILVWSQMLGYRGQQSSEIQGTSRENE